MRYVILYLYLIYEFSKKNNYIKYVLFSMFKKIISYFNNFYLKN